MIQRSEGRKAWHAAVVPRTLARFILVEPKLWACLVRWATGRYPNDSTFRYDRSLRGLIWVVVGLVVVEGAIVELVLALAVPGTVWIWVSLGVHAYALLGLLGLLASWITRPHLLDEHTLRLRDGVSNELVIPYTGLTEVRHARQPHLGRSGFKINGNEGLLAHGDATVLLSLDPNQPIAVTTGPHGVGPATLAITVDTPQEFVEILRARIAAAQTHAHDGLG